MTEPDMSEPLNGIRVIDLTHVWSGPSAAKQLAALGAEVIKVEGPRRMDFLRGTGTADAPSRYPNLEHGDDPWNRNAWFNTVNTDKCDVVIDLKSPEGVRILLDLVEQSHLVMANYRPGVLDRMGLGYSVLRGRQPDIIVIEMTGYGSTGPMAGLQAYGAQFDAMSGAAWLTGDGERPLLTGFALSDPVAGLAAASAAVTAIAKWRRTGRGSHLEVIQRDAMVTLHGEYLIAASLDDATLPGLNADADGFPHDLYQLSDGEWVAIAVFDATGWQGLLDTVDATTRNDLQAYPDYQAACASAEDVDRIVRHWVSRQSHGDWLATVLQENGVCAAPVNNAGDLYRDERLRRSGFMRNLCHPRIGEHFYPSVPMTVDGQRLGPRRAAPCLDQDTDRILQDLCGLSGAEITDLRRRGVVGASPDAMPGSVPASRQDTTNRSTQ